MIGQLVEGLSEHFFRLVESVAADQRVGTQVQAGIKKRQTVENVKTNSKTGKEKIIMGKNEQKKLFNHERSSKKGTSIISAQKQIVDYDRQRLTKLNRSDSGSSA